MRVLLLTGLYPTPGRLHEGAAVARQCEALRAAGVEIDVLHGSPAGVWQRRRTLEALRRAAARGRYDLVHVHYGLSATGLALLQPLPFVATYHGTDVNGYPFCAWREVGRALAWSGAAALTRQLARFARAVIVMTEAMRRRLPPAVQRKTWVEPMGVDTTLFRPRGRDAARAALGWGPEPIVVFCHPGGTAQKRADLAAAAVGVARRRCPDLRLVVLRGLEPARMPLALSAADCLLLTSEREGSPNVVREALACNLPVVAVPVGDVTDLVGAHPACGLVVPREPARLGAAVLEVLARPRSEAPAALMQRHSAAASARRIRAVYAAALGCREAA
ncbi:MAG: hypothetical protein A3E31_13620 [Candidatus Rokubacteria bacterium RIFCSPHIGHO2_12_FULL_73_22]|nr:MAG: hypothetical protein A3D33_06935 [Candidatus Rokubacteria bacterium RIFCSPHIGHO2_02_FULL_73_26]OGL01881.1 MAG: hypothetical protein A3E31_13620 [Candidatus Rokubacteria bacterium RIFCSPHIGHO2_12_FULL_73_22]OGL09145.1 MAG: hypothetical protein A3I14_10025 [Candidatus Rokubacteria bacterium RIFCSPLOWO2_02_FULL_73_56]OGL25873.1 MAG: hypothetical protein A3G44_11745 [Candidatus Rokubacteria bacterium RIFCSPLOWO2_12_FULL_73_47]